VSRAVRWRWLTVAAVTAVAVAWRGGYTPESRGTVTVLAGVAVLSALWVAPEASARASREPIVVALVLLAVLSALSAAWTIGSPATALRDAAIVLALAAVVVAAAALPASWAHGGLLLVAALGAALDGLTSTLVTAEPGALRICGTWRPAGPFQYPPTLALVCAGALPVALAAASESRRRVSAAGVLAAWLLATTIALTGNRSGIALGALAIAACVALAPRGRALGAPALGVLLAATLSALVLEGDLAGAGAARVAAALLIGLAAAGALSLSAGGRLATGGRRPWVATVAVAAVLATLGGVLAEPGGCGGELTHGRIGIWRAAVRTGAERPLEGFGSGTFLLASRERQLRERPVPTRYAHDLPLESWVELGLGGMAAVLAWYLAVAVAVVKRRRLEHAWVLIPALAAFPLANLLDWPWQLAGSGVLWAVAAGGVLGARRRAADGGTGASLQDTMRS
jgi:O-antigen ligase